MVRARSISVALLVLGAALFGSSQADAGASRVVKGPYVTGWSDTQLDVRFELDAPAAATLEIGRRGQPPRKIADGVAAMHVVHVTGLEPGKRYLYAVSLGGPVVATGSVTTAPKPDSGAPIRFVVYGDTRSDPEAHASIVRDIASIPFDFLVNTGDVVEDGASDSDWESFFQIEGALLRQRPIFAAIGNHELYDDAAGAAFARYFGFSEGKGPQKPYGSARLGSARFFFLNGMHDWDSGEERRWLEQELTRADAEAGLSWRVAVVHHGPWSSGPHGGNEKLLSAHVPELLAAHHVDLLLAGHDHIYERGQAGPIKYVISGGGGAPPYRVGAKTATTQMAEGTYHFVELTVAPMQVQLVARRMDLSVLDKCSFTKDRPWECQGPSTPAMMPLPSAVHIPAPPRLPQAPAASSSSRCSVGPIGSRGRGPATAEERAGSGALALLGAGTLAVFARRRQRPRPRPRPRNHRRG